MNNIIAGIDYGSKTAGTTAICVGNDEGIVFSISQTRKGEDADKFLMDAIKKHKVRFLFIDAPLSLPGVYARLEGFNDFFYRKCDREIGAMSPMFLGGLTARAVRFKEECFKISIPVKEVWPTRIAGILGIEKDSYKSSLTNIKGCTDIILETIRIGEGYRPVNWHQLDAALAFISGLRFINGNALSYGDPGEGIIYA